MCNATMYHNALFSHKHALIPDTVVRHGKSESLTGQIIYTGAEIKSEKCASVSGEYSVQKYQREFRGNLLKYVL